MNYTFKKEELNFRELEYIKTYYQPRPWNHMANVAHDAGISGTEESDVDWNPDDEKDWKPNETVLIEVPWPKLPFKFPPKKEHKYEEVKVEQGEMAEEVKVEQGEVAEEVKVEEEEVAEEVKVEQEEMVEEGVEAGDEDQVWHDSQDWHDSRDWQDWQGWHDWQGYAKWQHWQEWQAESEQRDDPDHPAQGEDEQQQPVHGWHRRDEDEWQNDWQPREAHQDGWWQAAEQDDWHGKWRWPSWQGEWPEESMPAQKNKKKQGVLVLPPPRKQPQVIPARALGTPVPEATSKPKAKAMPRERPRETIGQVAKEIEKEGAIEGNEMVEKVAKEKPQQEVKVEGGGVVKEASKSGNNDVKSKKGATEVKETKDKKPNSRGKRSRSTRSRSPKQKKKKKSASWRAINGSQYACKSWKKKKCH